MDLVTLDEAKANLMVTFDDADEDIKLKIKAASRAVLTYLKNRTKLYAIATDSDGVELKDSNGTPIYIRDSNGTRIIRDDVKLATLTLVGIFFRDPDGSESKLWGAGYLPAAVTALLYPLRDPTLA